MPLVPSHHTRLATHAAIIAIAALVIQACDSTSPKPATLSGTVVLQDAWATRLGDFSGVQIALDGQATRAVTDASGAWTIRDVPSGRHDIAFTKETFGTVHLVRENVFSPSTKIDVTMATPPWQQAVIDSITVSVAAQSGKDYYLVAGHLSAPPPADARFVTTVAFIGGTSAVSPDTTSFAQWSQFVDPTGKLSRFLIVFDAGAMRSTFGAGAQAYVTAYVSASVCTCYPDQPITKAFFSNTGPRANVVPLMIK